MSRPRVQVGAGFSRAEGVGPAVSLSGKKKEERRKKKEEKKGSS